MNEQPEIFLRLLGVMSEDAAKAINLSRNTPAARHVAEFIAHPEQRILLLCGATSVGKTIAALSWLTQLHAYGKAGDDVTNPAGWEWLRARTAFVEAPALSRLNLRYRDSDRDLLDKLKTAQWLVLDELGLETQDSISILEELIGARSKFGWTVITTNVPCGPKFDSSLFVQRYGARIADRIAGNGRVCGCGDLNLRRGGA